MLVADTHVHIYACYAVDRVVAALTRNLAELDSSATRVAVLAEKSDCRFFRDTMRQQTAGQCRNSMISPDGSAMLFLEAGAPSLYLFPGRQIVTAERLEILCLLADAEIEDGLPARDAVEMTREAGGVPVLSWAVGKWLFSRSSAVKALLTHFEPGELLLGDTAMRPTFWGEPTPMKRARKSGFSVIAGTDPLSFRGQEELVGTYASLIPAELDAAQPAASLRAALLKPSATIRSVGRRSGLGEFIRRMRG